MTPTVTISRELAEKLKITSEFALSFAVPSLAANIESDLAELRAALDAPASSGWRPIESAPRDGSKIIVWDEAEVLVAWWANNAYFPDKEEMRWVHGELESPEGWTYPECQPTHWQPLPPQPGDDVSTTDGIQWSEYYAGCTCHRCIRENDIRLGAFRLSSARMIVCPECGNKRCPHASDHDLACTGSNEPGQPGSVFTKAITDSDRLDWLESKGNGTPWIARHSTTGRGYRLHNTSQDGSSRTAREAIDAAIKQDKT